MPATIGAVGAPILGGLLGSIFSSGDKSQAQQIQQQALQGLQNLKAPTVQDLQIALQQYKLTGQMNPVLQSVISQEKSGMNNIQTDPSLMKAQMTALSKLQSMGNGGLQPQDLAAL